MFLRFIHRRRVGATFRSPRCKDAAALWGQKKLTDDLRLWVYDAIIVFVLMLQLSKWSPWMTEYARAFPGCAHTHTHSHSKNTVLYNFWFRVCCWQKWTQKSKQFSCSSIDSVCLFCRLQWKHSLLQVSVTQIYKFPSMLLLLCLFLVLFLSRRASVRQMCSTTKQARTLNESNFISPTTTLIVCEVSKMFPKTHTHTAAPPLQLATAAAAHSVWMTVFTVAINYWIDKPAFSASLQDRPKVPRYVFFPGLLGGKKIWWYRFMIMSKCPGWAKYMKYS